MTTHIADLNKSNDRPFSTIAEHCIPTVSVDEGKPIVHVTND